MLFYGTKASRLGTFPARGTTCSHCGTQGEQRISVFGKYAHIYWIPIFPIGKKAVAECASCLRTIDQKEFSPQLSQLYQQNSRLVKRPIWHWAGLGVIGLFILGSTLIDATTEEDPRDQLLQADIAAMTASPGMEADSFSYKLKQLFDNFATEEVNPQGFEYLSRVNGDKALILVKIPNLKNVEKGAREEAARMVEIVAESQPDLQDKTRYIGIHGKYNMMMVWTPTDSTSGNIVSASPLYEFYGLKAEGN